MHSIHHMSQSLASELVVTPLDPGPLEARGQAPPARAWLNILAGMIGVRARVRAPQYR